MLSLIYRSTIVTLLLTAILCGVYPLTVFLVGRVFFPSASSGGIIERDGKPVGAKLIGQNFSKPEYFHGRPSAAGQNGYDGTSSSGSNLGPTNQKFLKSIDDNVKKVIQENPGLHPGEVPVDLVTASGSGLDPHISPESAMVQIARIAKARNISEDKVKALVEKHIEERQLGMLGERVVNVLMINLDLDRDAPTKNQ
jgi:potassium-transporting ATPase KdpC subunit